MDGRKGRRGGRGEEGMGKREEDERTVGCWAAHLDDFDGDGL